MLADILVAGYAVLFVVKLKFLLWGSCIRSLRFGSRYGGIFGKGIKGGVNLRIDNSVCWGVDIGVSNELFRGVNVGVKMLKVVLNLWVNL